MDGGREELARGEPPASRMRQEVAFADLPADVRDAVLRVYRQLWNLA